MTKPVVLLSANYDAKQGQRPYIGRGYCESVGLAGGIPLIVPYHAGEGDIDAILERGDALIMTGGPDVDPALYGAAKHEKTVLKYEKAQVFDLEMVRRAHARGMPVLGICLGAQQVNVALGGTLHQHLPEDVGPEPRHHRVEGDDMGPQHMVRIERGTLLEEIVGTTEVLVNSFHHQAIREVAGVLKVSARSVEDGVIEGVESKTSGNGFVLGIQWHPEIMAEPGTPHQKRFEALVNAARRA